MMIKLRSLDRQKTTMQEERRVEASHLTLREACEIVSDLGMDLDEVVIRQGRSGDWQYRALPVLVWTASGGTENDNDPQQGGPLSRSGNELRDWPS